MYILRAIVSTEVTAQATNRSLQMGKPNHERSSNNMTVYETRRKVFRANMMERYAAGGDRGSMYITVTTYTHFYDIVST